MVNFIVQITRQSDGTRKVTHVSEITGMEGDVITTQELFTFEVDGELPDGKLSGQFRSTGLRPYFVRKAAYFGLEKALCDVMS